MSVERHCRFLHPRPAARRSRTCRLTKSATARTNNNSIALFFFHFSSFLNTHLFSRQTREINPCTHLTWLDFCFVKEKMMEKNKFNGFPRNFISEKRCVRRPLGNFYDEHSKCLRRFTMRGRFFIPPPNIFRAVLQSHSVPVPLCLAPRLLI